MRVELGDRSYDIYIGENWLPKLGQLLGIFPKTSQAIMITDENVSRLWSQQVFEVLAAAGFKVEKTVIPGGEGCKNLTTAAQLHEHMVTIGLDRKSLVLALGGGIVGDIAGFVAATYMRGINYIQIPTTLLAQVDSSVGGKTGVNLPQGKNLVGAFYQPDLVFIDTIFLTTLPEREFLTGLAEVIKYGIIWDQDFFAYLETQRQRIQARDSECLLHIISRCCTIKADIVAQDETEQGVRALLNLGHTYGHAFEALSNYRFTHGEAVAIGTICAARLASDLGLLATPDLERIIALIHDYGLPTDYGDLDTSDIIVQMHTDKKNVGGKMQLVLPIALGKSQLFDTITEDQVAASLNNYRSCQ